MLASLKSKIKRIKRLNFKVRIGLIMFLSLLVIATIFSYIDTQIRLKGVDPTTPWIAERFLPPSPQHPLGTSQNGADVLGSMLVALRNTLIIGIISGTITTVIATFLGFLSAYKGGVYDYIIRNVTDFMLVVPSWPILAVMAAYIRKIDVIGISLILSIFNWSWAARTIRSQVLSLKEKPYVDLARVSGLGDMEIVFKELMVNLLPYIVVSYANSITNAILAETGLRLIGVGPAELPTLGFLLQMYLVAGFLTTRVYVAALIVALIAMTFLSLNFINMGLEEIYNPRLKKITGM